MDGEVAEKRIGWIGLVNLVAWIGMLVVNLLANVLPFAGTTTGAVSDAYPNLFTPAGLTFSIWGVIYILQGLYVASPFGIFGRTCRVRTDIVRASAAPFVAYALLNIAWLFAWHHHRIALSMILMVLLLGSCIWGYLVMERFQPQMRLPDKIFVRLAFRVTLGWITVATVANMVILLVWAGWDGWGIAPQTWTVIVLAVTLCIALAVTLSAKDAVYGMVILWAYMGILLRHLSTGSGGHGRAYSPILLCLIACLVILFTAVMLAIHRSRRRAGKLPEANLLK
ncbi:MAG: tryptophan-rich sensory protein [Clostridiaceae bacterium]|jgi:hypothetical protein|nr:tryptophan-rich sensory protein [Clostridiaceae bacterium]